MPFERKEIDPELVRKLASLGCTYNEIASIVGCSHDTLSRRFKAELEEGRMQGNASLRRKQFEVALAGNVTMLIWLGKQHLGQTDKQDLSVLPREIKVKIGGLSEQKQKKEDADEAAI